MSGGWLTSFASVVYLFGCAAPAPDCPQFPPTPAASAPAPAPVTPSAPVASVKESAVEEPEAPEELPRRAPPEPEFTEHMSVDQALRAVPMKAERVNIEPEVLAAPLEDSRVYAPCRPAGSHFKVRVAVWNGKAVGVDVQAPDRNLTDCIDKRVRELTWRTKVRSLNTIEFNY